MKKLSIAILMSFAFHAGIASAQTGTTGVTESTDPAKIAAIEQRAQQLAQAQTTTNVTGSKAVHHTKPMAKKMHAKKHHTARKKSTTQSAAAGGAGATGASNAGAPSGATAPSTASGTATSPTPSK